MTHQRSFVRAAALIAAALLGLTACGPKSTVDLPNPPIAPNASTAPSAASSTQPAAAVSMRGDAATNPACALATPAEIAQVAGGTVVDELGVSGPGGYSPALWSCTWHFADTDISAPAVVVLFERTATVHDEVITYDRSLVTQKYATDVPGLGDVAILRGGHDLDVVSQKIILKVHAQLHNGPDESSLAVAVGRLILPRIAP